MPMDEAMFASVREANGPLPRRPPAPPGGGDRRRHAARGPRGRERSAQGRRRHLEPDPETARTEPSEPRPPDGA